MKRYLAAYGIWLAGVLSAAAVAFFFYRRILVIGELELAGKLDGDTFAADLERAAGNGNGPPDSARRQSAEASPEAGRPRPRSSGPAELPREEWSG